MVSLSPLNQPQPISQPFESFECEIDDQCGACLGCRGWTLPGTPYFTGFHAGGQESIALLRAGERKSLSSDIARLRAFKRQYPIAVARMCAKLVVPPTSSPAVKTLKLRGLKRLHFGAVRFTDRIQTSWQDVTKPYEAAKPMWRVQSEDDDLPPDPPSEAAERVFAWEADEDLIKQWDREGTIPMPQYPVEPPQWWDEGKGTYEDFISSGGGAFRTLDEIRKFFADPDDLLSPAAASRVNSAANEAFRAQFPQAPVHSPYPLWRRVFDWWGKHPNYGSKSITGKYVKLDREQDHLTHMIEGQILFIYHMSLTRTFAGRAMAIATQAKMFNTKLSEISLIFSALQSAAEWYWPVKPKKKKKASLEPQGMEETFSSVQDFLDKYDTIKASPLFEKMYKFGTYALALSLFQPLGITMDLFKFDAVVQEAMRQKYHLGPDFVHTMLDTALFLTRRGFQCYQTGSLMPMFHSAEKYQKWYDAAELLLRQSHFLSNPEPHGIDRHKFLSDLKDTIECGRSMKKCALKKDDKLLIGKLLANLELTHDLEVTKRNAQKDRKYPLCVLLFGGSGIGKSTILNIMFQHYGKVRKKPTTSEFRYVRNPNDPFWSGMNSTQWCVWLDDIAFLAAQLGILDPSLAEMLCIANNVPYVPNQAELCDKGRTPVRFELCLGSTNTEDLNLHAYFSCPLAVQRRFPWILDISVKLEYQCPDKPGMLDSSRVPVTPAGEYPDLWNFKIKRVEPCGTDRRHQKGKTVVDREITSMREFLKWYNQIIEEHNTVQDKILAGNARMFDTKLCGTCAMPETWCSCVHEVVETDLFGEREFDPDSTVLCEVCTLPLSCCTCTQAATHDLFGEHEMASPAYIHHAAIEADRDLLRAQVHKESISARVAIWLYDLVYRHVRCTALNYPVAWWFGEYWFTRLLARSPHRLAMTRVLLRYAGARVSKTLGTPKTLAAITATLVGMAALYKLHGHLVKQVISAFVQGSEQSVPQEPVFEMDGTPPDPDPVFVQRPSYADPWPFRTDDLSQATLCSKGSDGSVLLKNVRYATCVFTSQDAHKKRTTCALNVRGTVYVCNNHGIPPTTPFNLDITTDKCSGGLVRNLSNVLVTSDMVLRIPEKDLVFIRLRCLPPGTDLTVWMAKESFVGNVDGKYVGRDVQGDLWEKEVLNVKPMVDTWMSHDKTVTAPTWGGIVADPTRYGDCGSTLMAQTGAGWTLLGMHTLGNARDVRALRFFPDLFTQCCDRLEPKVVARGSVEVSAPSCHRAIEPLHAQSVVRVVEGSANVLGSFIGEFRTRGRTRVRDTVMADFLAARGFERTRTRPDVSRTPWRVALQDMVNPVVRLRSDLLEQARLMYQQETIRFDLAGIHVYDVHTALNGQPGVAFCDKMPRKTSAGAPYKCSKSRFLYFLDDGTTDVGIVDEIKKTIRTIITTYLAGQRYHAVYCGQLKDEPVTFAKAEAGKTRVFTMAGMSHTIVTRMYLLPVVVFMQKHSFDFEIGVGVSPQCLEWQKAYEYLTAFGTDRMVAGDYAKFDKRMPANVILATFDVLLNICERAGYTQDQLKVVRGIAYDTAFPTVDYNGDLIEFFGSNPSGHALTVIVNSIANSLYMRYTFLVLRPMGVKEGFKSFVRLWTYGDDNAMGVSPSAPWFNHTAIQKVLADVGIGYTMADKDAISVPYISMAEVSFLKRTWRWEDEIGAHVGPLCRESIEKSLMICVEKSNVSEKAHAVQVISTAVREAFFHGRDEFERMRNLLVEVVAACELEAHVESTTFPTWSQLLEDFAERSAHVVCAAGSYPSNSRRVHPS